jgi:hypothetical protein
MIKIQRYFNAAERLKISRLIDYPACHTAAFTDHGFVKKLLRMVKYLDGNFGYGKSFRSFAPSL